MKKFRTVSFVLMACIFWTGCNQSGTATLPQPNSSENNTTAKTNADDAPSTSTPEPQSAQEVIEAMQAQLTSSGDSEAAIAIGQKGRKRFSKDDNLTKALATLMYQSIQSLADHPENLIARRLELGDMARSLTENSESIEQLGNMPSFLLLEEAKGHILNKNLEKGWQSIVESRSHGFRQTKILFLDAELDPIVQNEQYVSEMQTWLSDEIDKELTTHEPFPFEFSLKSLTEDDTMVSHTDFDDKEWTLVDLWGTWCPPCRAEIPHLVELQTKLQDRVAFVGINFEKPIGDAEYDEAKTKLEDFQKLQPMNYPCLHGDFEPSEKIVDFVGFPTMLLLDKKGMVRLVMTGYQPLPVLEATIERVLNN